MPPVRRAVLLLATAGSVAACASSGSSDWHGAAPGHSEQNPVEITPVTPPPTHAAGGASKPGGGHGSGGPKPSSPSSPAKQPDDPAVVAKHLSSPLGIAVLPDFSALVGERTTGKILHVQPSAGQPTPTVKRLTGLDTSGDGGLLDLALSPHYLEDNLIYAYITTPTDNRVVDFTLTGPVTPVLTGIPQGATGNAGRIAFGANGALYVGTGDAGNATLAADPNSLAGKVLRITDIGDPADGNPTPSSPVYTRGHNDPAGVCVVPGTGHVFETEARANGIGELNLLAPGSNYGWPTASPSTKAPAAVLPATAKAPGGCAADAQTVYITSLDGKRLLASTLSGTGNNVKLGAFRVVLGAKYGRLRTAVAATDGSVWLTTSNKDGHGKPVAEDERVIRIMPNSGGGGGPT